MAERVLRRSAIGDVLHDADHPRDPALLVAQDAGALVDPAHGAVGPDDAVLDGVGAAVGHRLLGGAAHRVDVVGVYARKELLRGAVELVLARAGDPEDLARPRQGARPTRR